MFRNFCTQKYLFFLANSYAFQIFIEQSIFVLQKLLPYEKTSLVYEQYIEKKLSDVLKY